MLDVLMTGLLESARPKAKPRQRVVFELEIRRDHPGLPRLYEAATKLHNCEVVRPGGLRLKKTQTLIHGEVLPNFFTALRDVVGDTMADELEERLGVREILAQQDHDRLVGLARDAANLIPSDMLKALKRG